MSSNIEPNINEQWGVLGMVIMLAFPIVISFIGYLWSIHLEVQAGFQGANTRVELAGMALACFVLRACGGVMYILTVLLLMTSPPKSFPKWMKDRVLKV